MRKKRITATDINNNSKENLDVINKKVKKFSKTLVCEEDQKEIEIENYKNSLMEELAIENENLLFLRRNIEGLNEIDMYSHLAEISGIQNINDDTLLEYEDMIKLSMKNSKMVSHIKNLKGAEFGRYNTKSFEREISNMEDIDILVTMRKMYNINNDYDPLKLYEKYSGNNNLEYAHELSLKILGNKSTNIVNDLLTTKNLNKLGVSSITNQKIISNKMLGRLLNKKLTSNNSVTFLENSFTNNDNNALVYRTRTIGELIMEITNEENESIFKEYRHQIYMVTNGLRPSKFEYHNWNGLQVLDLDLKLWMNDGGDLHNLKIQLHKILSSFHWYLCIAFSASRNGLHIYTKVTPPHHTYLKLEDNERVSKYFHRVNYATKYNTLNSILQYFSNSEQHPNIKFDEKFYNKYLDVSVGRITSGIKLTYDSTLLVNEKFVDLHVGFGLSQTINKTLGFYGDEFENETEIKDYLLRTDSKHIQVINRELLIEKEGDSRDLGEIDISKYVKLNSSFDATKITEIPRKNINYVTRYNVCNTLAHLYGSDGLAFAHKILNSRECDNENEINAFYSSALTNSKTATKIGLDVLRKVGLLKYTTEHNELGEEIINPLVQETDDIFRKELRQAIEKSLLNVANENDYNLLSTQYLSDIKTDLINKITGDKINIVLSPPGSGKTELIKTLARDEKRILLVLPYVSVINNKIVTDESITSLFDSYYGDKNFREAEYGRSACITFDKFSKANYDKLSNMYDYVFIDESHLLFVSQYRVEATSHALKKIKALFNISKNSPIASKVVLLTGTTTGESYFFGSIGNIIKIGKPQLTKNAQFDICGDLLDATTRLVSTARRYIENGYKLIIPTNAGEIYVEKIVGMLNYLLDDRVIKYGYYKSSNKEQEICQLIDTQGTVGDYDIVFCTNYLSVGVDINDKNFKFATLFLGEFSGFEVEQFVSRLRKIAIESHIFIATTNAQGEFLPKFMEEPNLLLRITDDDKANFIDDKQIAKSKQEFIAQYDPILFKISTPGFSIFQGKIQFSLEEYELCNFENKYLEVMSHPIKISRALAQYGYNVTVSTQISDMSLGEQKLLKKIGAESSAIEKVRKHTLFIETYRDLIRNNSHTNFNGIEVNNVIDWIIKNPKEIKEDRVMEKHVVIDYTIFGQPLKATVKSFEYLNKVLRYAKYLSERYTKFRALHFIDDFINEDGVLNMGEFEKKIRLLKLKDKSDRGELSEAIDEVINKIHFFIDTFEINSTKGLSRQNLDATIEQWVYDYLDLIGVSLNTKYGFDKVRDSVVEMLNTLGTKYKSKMGIRYRYNKVQETDGANSIISIDKQVTSLFKLERSLTNDLKRSKFEAKHIMQQHF